LGNSLVEFYFSAVGTLIGIVIIVSITDEVLSLVWLPLYYRYGIRLYCRKVSGGLPEHSADLINIVDCSQSGFVFHRLSKAEIAFRDRVIRFFRVAIMHGRIINYGSHIEIVGLVDWSTFFVFLFFLSMCLAFLTGAPVSALLMMVVLIGGIGLSYKITCERLDALADEIAAQSQQ
jgi:hypothetical protein